MRLTPSPVKQLATEHGIQTISPESVKNEDVLREIKNWGAEAAVVVAFGQILPQAFLDIFPQKTVNVHASLLPRWRGAAPIQRAIEAGDRTTGVSLQVMVKKLDAGDVIGRYELAIDDAWDAVRLHNELIPLGARLLQTDFRDYLRGNLSPTPQDESLVTYASKIEKSESRIEWANKTAVQIRNHIRAMALGPGSVTTLQSGQTTLNDRPLKVLWGDVVPASGEPGQIVAVDRDSFTVACADGALRVTRIQPQSKPAMSTHDFLLGHMLKIGDRLI